MQSTGSGTGSTQPTCYALWHHSRRSLGLEDESADQASDGAKDKVNDDARQVEQDGSDAGWRRFDIRIRRQVFCVALHQSLGASQPHHAEDEPEYPMKGSRHESDDDTLPQCDRTGLALVEPDRKQGSPQKPAQSRQFTKLMIGMFDRAVLIKPPISPASNRFLVFIVRLLLSGENTTTNRLPHNKNIINQKYLRFKQEFQLNLWAGYCWVS